MEPARMATVMAQADTVMDLLITTMERDKLSELLLNRSDNGVRTQGSARAIDVLHVRNLHGWLVR